MPSPNSSRLYTKLFFTYTAVIVLIVAALVAYFVTSTRSRILKSNQDYMELMSDRGIGYLEQCYETAVNINNELYQTSTLMDDLLHFLRDSAESYQRYRLDTYISSSSARYTGVDGFAEKLLDANSSITKISFVSYDKEEKTSFYPDGNNKKSAVQGINKEGGRQQGEGRELVRDTYESFSFQKEIRDPVDRRSVGLMSITFQTDKLHEIAQSSGLPEMFLISTSGTVLFDSGRVLDEKTLKAISSSGEVEEILDAFCVREPIDDYILYTYIGKEAAAQVPISAFLTILMIGVGLIFVGEFCVHLYLSRLTKRLAYILEGMERVTTGDMSVRLVVEEGGGDELDVISGKFNEMCVELDRYIQKSYLAEIEQKNAEIEVLQSQINPHFLYNTLEAIRMKAICNGDREVGKMLYSMAVIFRSQLKDADVIPLIQEIHYCKKYLELFEYRYQGRFTFQVECPEELMQVPVIKFIIQPVLENYFIHGITPEQEDNQIHITVQKVENGLWIHVIDNGRGMEQEQIEEKSREFLQKDSRERKSIGLKNVNRRLQAVYGSEYGIILMQSSTGGLHVILKTGMGE